MRPDPATPSAWIRILQRFVLADVAGGVSAASAGLATYFYFTRPEVQKRTATRRLSLGVAKRGKGLELSAGAVGFEKRNRAHTARGHAPARARLVQRSRRSLAARRVGWRRQKLCDGACIPTDPDNGVRARVASPAPCLTPHPVCANDGACAIAACIGSYENCDGKPENGCEVNLDTDLEHCGDCDARPCIRWERRAAAGSKLRDSALFAGFQ
jgi:hypothetical protein